jgi:uncharacterized protein (UPF0210 family)
MRKTQGSLAGWLFADLTLVISIVMLSSWTINKESTSTETVTLEKYNLLLEEKSKSESELAAVNAELAELKTELEKLKSENSKLRNQLGLGETGVKLEPVSIIISASELESSDSIFNKIEKALEDKGVDTNQQFSFALIFAGTTGSQSKDVLEIAKSRAKEIGREKYVRPFHETGLPDGYFKIELYPSN